MALDIVGKTATSLPTSHTDVVHVKHDEPTAAQQETGKPSTLDTVSVTDTAKQLSNLEAHISNQPVVDTQRVESMRTELAKGSLGFDANRVAEKFFEFEMRLTA